MFTEISNFYVDVWIGEFFFGDVHILHSFYAIL